MLVAGSFLDILRFGLDESEREDFAEKLMEDDIQRTGGKMLRIFAEEMAKECAKAREE